MPRPPDASLPNTGYAVLGLLAMAEELTGYELRKWAESLRFFYWSPAQSQIYGELRRLAALGFVSAREVPQGGRPDKRLYRITEAGVTELRRWMEETPVEPPVVKHSVALRLFFGRFASPQRLRALLDAYVDDTRRTLAELERLRVEIVDDPRFTYPSLVAEWGLRYFAGEIEAAGRAAERLPGVDAERPPTDDRDEDVGRGHAGRGPAGGEQPGQAGPSHRPWS